jgi:urea transport system permease protein
MQQIFQILADAAFNGVSTGAVLLITALGLAIVFGLMGVINMAHGELMMIGAYSTYVVQQIFKPTDGSAAAWYWILIALPVSFGIAAAVGFLLERTVIRYLYGRPLETLLATWGVSLMLRELVRSASSALAIGIVLFAGLFCGGLALIGNHPQRSKAVPILFGLAGGLAWSIGALFNKPDGLGKLWFGKRNIDVTAPGWLRGGLSIGSFQMPSARLFIIVLTLICLGAMYWFLQKSAWGLRIRAVTQNRSMSACLGIPTATVDALTFSLGSGLAGVAGCAVTLLGSVGPNLGGNYIVDAFMVVVVGGVGKITGTIVAALGIGTINYLLGSGSLALLVSGPKLAILQPLVDFFTFFATTSMAKVMVFTLIVAFLQVRPAGLFPQKGRTVDA